MDKNLNGKFESVDRVGIRNKETKELVRVYPYKVKGTEQEIENEVKSWFYPNISETEKHFENCFVDTLTYKELMNAKDSFVD